MATEVLPYSLQDAPDGLTFNGPRGSYGYPGDLSDAPDTLQAVTGPVQYLFTSGSLIDSADTLYMFQAMRGQLGVMLNMSDAPDTLVFHGLGGSYIGSSFMLTDGPDTLYIAVANGIDAAAQEYILYAMNMKNGSVTKLPYAVDSLCELNGIIYAAGPQGIIIFEASDTNNGADINARIARGGMNFGSNMLKTITEFRMRCRTQGHMKITSSSGTESGSVTTEDEIDIVHGFKSDMPRGVNGQELGIAIENVDGCDFEITEFEHEINISKSRRGRQTRN